MPGQGGVWAESLQRASMPAQRGGLLRQASILTVLAHPKESAPVLRGKWILSQLLCQTIPPPPPDVPQEPMAQVGATRKERLAAHRIEPTCKSCHELMDPPGLALEQYDGIGAYRTEDNGAPIDPSGQLASGSAFTGPDDKPITLAAFSGKTILVNIWATWCVPCRKEMPALDRLEATAGGKDFEVVAVNIDIDGRDRARQFLEEIGVSHLAFYSDPTTAVFSNLKKRGLVFGLPTTIIADKVGCRLGVVAGPAEWDSPDAAALIEAAKADPPPAG